MSFNITKGTSNDYLASVYLTNPWNSSVFQQAALYPGQKVEVSSKNETDIFTIVIYPISNNPGDLLIKTKWTNGFPWWGILLIVFFGTLFLLIVLIIIIVLIVLLIRCLKTNNRNTSSTRNRKGFTSVDDVRSEDDRKIPDPKLHSGKTFMNNTYGTKNLDGG